MKKFYLLLSLVLMGVIFTSCKGDKASKDALIQKHISAVDKSYDALNDVLDGLLDLASQPIYSNNQKHINALESAWDDLDDALEDLDDALSVLDDDTDDAMSNLNH